MTLALSWESSSLWMAFSTASCVAATSSLHSIFPELWAIQSRSRSTTRGPSWVFILTTPACTVLSPSNSPVVVLPQATPLRQSPPQHRSVHLRTGWNLLRGTEVPKRAVPQTRDPVTETRAGRGWLRPNLFADDATTCGRRGHGQRDGRSSTSEPRRTPGAPR